MPNVWKLATLHVTYLCIHKFRQNVMLNQQNDVKKNVANKKESKKVL